ncbi:MAG: AlpA family transcriptional regulator [Alphaproteobacteria bacterium]|nr:AlpA family transcriptional regulator [Alphaproteobacteria bacterium]
MRILKLPQVMEATALSRSSIYAYIKAQKFPAQINIGVKAVGWESDAINQWLEERIAASRSGAQQ